jgi:hypothetical protein
MFAFHSSVAVVVTGPSFPPNAKPVVEVPAPPEPFLAVFKSFVSVQIEPFHDSVLPTAVVISPPKLQVQLCL